MAEKDKPQGLSESQLAKAAGGAGAEATAPKPAPAPSGPAVVSKYIGETEKN